MGVFDNFANRFRGDDYDEDEDLDEYEDEEEEETPRRGSFGGRKKQSDYEDEDEYEEQPKGRTSLTGNSSRSRNTRSGAQDLPAQRAGRSGAQAQAGGGRMQVRIIKPSSFDQARQITDTLLAHRTVLLNLEGLDINTAQRIVDFASGSCYALRGNFMKISQYIIVITPEDVDIAGDVAAAGGQQEAAAAAAFMGAAASAQGMSGGMPNNVQGDGSNPFRGSGMGSMMGGIY